MAQYEDFVTALHYRLDVLYSEKESRILRDRESAERHDLACLHSSLLVTFSPGSDALAGGGMRSEWPVPRSLEFSDNRSALSAGESETDSVLVQHRAEIGGLSEAGKMQYVLKRSDIQREHDRDTRKLLAKLDQQKEEDKERAREMARRTVDGWRREAEQSRLSDALERVSLLYFNLRFVFVLTLP